MVLPSLKHENKLWKKGFTNIVGIDEVGRGSWAGPLVAAGVIFPKNFKIPKGLADSKLISEKNREDLDQVIRNNTRYFISEVSHSIIFAKGLTQATQIAFEQIVDNLKPEVDFVLVDAFRIKSFPISKQLAIIHGDMISASIAAASIIAKVYRDNLMKQISKKYPKYGFENHKGYGTKKHQLAIKENGFCQIHRTNYKLKFLLA